MEFAEADERLRNERDDCREVNVNQKTILEDLAVMGFDPGSMYVFYSCTDIDPDQIGCFINFVQLECRIVFVKEPWIDSDIYMDFEIDYDLASTFLERTWAITRRGKDRHAEISSERRREGQLRREHPGAPPGKRLPSQNEIEFWRIIYHQSRYFKGNKTNRELMGPEYCGIAKNSFYLYKKHLEEFLQQGGDLSSLTLEILSKYKFS